MTRYELTASEHRHPATNALHCKSFTTADFRSLPRVSADSAISVTGRSECRIHQTAVPHPRNSTPTLPSERTLPRTSADPSYRPEA